MRFVRRGNEPRYSRIGNPEPDAGPEQRLDQPALPTPTRSVTRHQRRVRRVAVLSSALVLVGVAAPVAAYACGFDPVHVRPVVEKSVSEIGGNQVAAKHHRSHRARFAGATAVETGTVTRTSSSSTPSATSTPSSSLPASSAPTTAAPVAAASSAAAPSTSSDGPFGLPLYDNPKPIADAAGISVASVRSQIAAKTTLGKIASYPMGQWFVDGHAGFANDVAQVVDDAAAAHSVATLVAYNIPHRDCGAYSAGGASSADAYRSWIRSFVGGLGSHKAIIVIEPDAIGLAPNCLSASQRAERYSLIKYAVDQFQAEGSWTYIDAGNSAWLSVPDVTAALKSSGIAEATGFALNTAQSRPDSELIPYGDKVSAAVGGKHYVIDSSRNGVAPKPNNYDWCNPADKGLGHQPSTSTGHALLDAFLWIKTPGGSDGSCNGAPGAGQWFPSYASMLLANAHLNG